MKWGEEIDIDTDVPALLEEDIIIEGKYYLVALLHDIVIEEIPTQVQGNKISYKTYTNLQEAHLIAIHHLPTPDSNIFIKDYLFYSLINL